MTRSTRATPAGVPRSRAKRTREQRDNPVGESNEAPTAKQRQWWRQIRKGVDSLRREHEQQWQSQARRHT